jgi:hypothetical protein
MLKLAHLHLLFFALICTASAQQEEGTRYALVIGNNSYLASPLQNAVNDARIMDKALKDAGFRSTLVENAGQVAFQSSIGQFLSKLGPSDTALFFYAGHGVQIENENFLVPVDFQPPDNLVEAKLKLFSVAILFDYLAKTRHKRTIVVLDACRSNPLGGQNALSAGLAQPQNAPNESFVVFSTGPGKTAADNPNGRNSYFTEALAMEIQKPGLSIDDVLTHTTATVSSETSSRQNPWHISSLKTTFYFHTPLNVEAESTASMAVKWMSDAKRFEQREEWEDAVDRVNQVIQKKPGGGLQAAAENRLGYLTARRDAQAAFDKGDYAAAATAYETAFKLDPFAIDAAFEGVNSYLLEAQVDQAVLLLHDIRVRGATESTVKAMKMLGELTAVNQPAAHEVGSAVPAPPPIEQMFSAVSFGVPDLEGGRLILAITPVDASRFVTEIEVLVPPVAPPADPAAATGAGGDQTAAMSQVLKGIFHLEVAATNETRDLAIRRAAAGSLDSNAGFLQLEGPDKQIPVLYKGQIQYLPAKLPLPAGKYEIQSWQDGKVVGTQEVEIQAGLPQIVTVKR